MEISNINSAHSLLNSSSPTNELKKSQNELSSIAEVLAGSEEAESSEKVTDELRDKFKEFVGQTFFGTLMQSLRKTTKEVPYFNGGRGEEIFRNQLDQIFVEHITESSGDVIADPMFDLMTASRK